MQGKKLLTAGLLVGALGMGVSTAEAQSVSVQVDHADGARERRLVVARPGDTLFDLSGQQLGDPLMWPMLWSYNPQITNPHWIYPGDVIFTEAIRERQERALPEGAGEYFATLGYYTSEELCIRGTLKYAQTGRMLLHEFDEVYVEFDGRGDDGDEEEDEGRRRRNRDDEPPEDCTEVEFDPNAVAPGDHFVLHRVESRVYNDDDELVAVSYSVVGEVRLAELHEETDLVTADVVELWDTIERGDALFLADPVRRRVPRVANTADAEGRIIDRYAGQRNLHEYDYVFLDIGTEDGVEVGNTVRIWGRRDEAAHYEAAFRRNWDYEEDVIPELPWEQDGRALIIHATEEYATAVIVDAAFHEIAVGQRITMTAGE